MCDVTHRDGEIPGEAEAKQDGGDVCLICHLCIVVRVVTSALVRYDCEHIMA